MLKRIKSKLKSKSGLTLTEMLITVILLMFFSSACLLGISTAISTRRDMIKAADADILASTVTQYISNELRLSINGRITEEGGKYKFEYDGGSTYANLTCGNSVIWINYEEEVEKGDPPKGCLMRSVGYVEDDKDKTKKYDINNKYSVFNKSAYSSFTLSDLEFKIDGDTIECSFVIKDSNGNTVKTAEETRFTVTPINTPPSGP